MAYFILFAIMLALLLAALLSYLKIVYEWRRKVKIVNQPTSSPGSSKKSFNSPSATVEIYEQAPGPIPLPVIGNLADIGQYEVPFEAFTALAKKYGDVYRLTLGATPCLVVNNLDLIREVLNQNGRYFGGRPDFLRFHKLFGGDRNNSLALCDWSTLQQKRRNLARKHCSPRDASSYYQKMSDVAGIEMSEMMDQLKKKVEPGKDMALKPLIMQTCANMFSQYMCSVRFDYEDSEFIEMVRCFDEIFWEINQGYAVDFLPWLAPFYMGHMNKLASWSGYIRKFLLRRIVDAREQNLDADEPERDFTDALLKSLREDETVSRDTIIYMLEDFLGGHSAIGNLVILILGHIARNPAVGKRIQDEVDRVTENGTRTVTLYDMERMPYTVATIFEVLRYSSSPIVPHVATEDTCIAGYGVTKGTIVFINNYELNSSEKYWTEPKLFQPDRFVETDTKTGNQRVKKNIPHFLPFSIGKRTCIGQNLVRGFTFVMLATLLQSYDVSANDIAAIHMFPACVAVPPDTFSISLTPRSKSTTCPILQHA